MSIKSVYENKLMQSVLFDFLGNLRIPTEPEIARRLDDLLIVADPNDSSQTITLDLSKPVLAQKNTTFNYRDPLSAGRLNRLVGTVHADFDVLYDAALEIEKNFIGSTYKSLQDLDHLTRQISDLTGEVNRLLLLTEDTEGTLHVVGDNFETAEKIDVTITTAKIDTERQRLTIGSTTGGGHQFESHNLEAISGAKIQTTSLVQGGLLSRVGSPTDIFNSSDNGPYVTEITVLQPMAVSMAIVIDFAEVSNIPLITNQISLNPYLQGPSVQVIIQHSLDGVTWKDLPVTDPIRSAAGIINYTFNDISFKYLRIMLVKDSYDELTQNSTYVYRFGINNLKVERRVTEFASSGTFQSTRHLPVNSEGEAYRFTKATISDICYEQLTGTSLEYYISLLVPDAEGVLQETEFQRVMPLSAALEEGADAVIAQMSAVSKIYDSAKAMRIADRTDNAAWIAKYEYTFEDSTGKAILVEPTVNGLEKPLEGSSADGTVAVWRGVGKNSEFRTVRTSENMILEQGWKPLSDGRLATYIEITNPGGFTIDFGSYDIEIDGQVLNGGVSLAEGVHYVVVSPDRWYSLDGLKNITDFDPRLNKFTGTYLHYQNLGLGEDVDQNLTPLLKDVDILYPYNHKLLIEGLEYSSDYLGERRYIGVARYASHYLAEVSAFELENGTDNTDYDKFAIIDVIDKGVNPPVRSKGILVNLDVSLITGENKEDFTVVRRPSAAVMAEGLIFKTILKTDDPKNSPSLEGYEIKIVQ